MVQGTPIRRCVQGTYLIVPIKLFIKICQNTPQLCWGDEWLSLSPGGEGEGEGEMM